MESQQFKKITFDAQRYSFSNSSFENCPVSDIEFVRINYLFTFSSNAKFAANTITNVTIPKNTLCNFLSNIDIAYITQNSSFSWSQFGCINLPSKETLTGQYLEFDNFCGTAILRCNYRDSTLITLNIPEGVEYVLSGAFSGTGALNLNFQNAVALRKIYEGAFSNSQIQSIIFPSTYNDFGVALFSGITSLTSVNIYSTTLTELKRYLFADCSQLNSITVNNFEFLKDGVLNFSKITPLDYIGENCLLGVPFKKIVISNTIDIKEFALIGIRGNTNLMEVVIPYYFNTFENNLFAGCTNLTTITMQTINILENRVLYLQYINKVVIEHSAFSGVRITDVRISESANFTEYSFRGVVGLTRIYVTDYIWKEEFYLPCTLR